MRVRLFAICLLLVSNMLSPLALANEPQPAQGNDNTVIETGSTAYITDQIKITLRSGPGLQYKILRMLSTGKRLTATNTISGAYTQVKLGDGTQGWVLTRYLLDEPPASQQLRSVTKQLANINETLASTQKNLVQKQTLLTQSQQAQQKLQQAYASLEQKYHNLLSSSQHAVSLQKENALLKQKRKETTLRIDDLSRENSMLSHQTDIRWFLTGGGVLLCGLILGIWLPKLVRKRRDNWFN